MNKKVIGVIIAIVVILAAIIGVVYLVNNDSFNYKLSYYEYSIISFDSDIIVDNKKLGKININDYKNYSYINSTKKIIFKSTENIIKSIFEYFDLIN